MELSCVAESWPIRGRFAISRGEKTEAQVIVATIRDGAHQGRGECMPYSRYGESVESVQDQMASVKSEIENGVGREKLQKLLPAGAARNALDCALWDLETKRSGKTIWELVGIQAPQPKPTAYTISLDTPEKMAAGAAEAAKTFSLLKIKIGTDDEGRLAAVRNAAPQARLIVDANEGWNESDLEANVRLCESAGVELIEQPVPAKHSNILKNVRTSILLCADESAHTSDDIQKVAENFGAVNVKLDKAGGLTEALKMIEKAKEAGLAIMVGCHVSTSLSMAPATVVAQYADYVDLDGPLLLERDRGPAIGYRDGQIVPTAPDLWV